MSRFLSSSASSRSAALFGCLLLAGETGLGLLIIHRARYTEIDWKAYMQEVQAVADGERDYTAIGANTGPLVYPAGFVWLYLGLHRLTGADPDCCRLPPTEVSESARCVSGGGDVRTAQYIGLGVSVATLALVLRVYRACGVPPWAWALACGSYRVHSLYLLRLFNDGPAMLLLFAFLAAYARRSYAAGALLFSAALSVKMNALLFAPALALLTLRECGWAGAVATAWPFLRANAAGYLGRAFELSRAFEHRWSVNWAMLSPAAFGSAALARGLLAAHLCLLLAFAHWRLLGGAVRGPLPPRDDAARHALQVALSCNFIGIAAARSLHYQFYLYYFHSLPVLLWMTPFPPALRLALWIGIEGAYNVYPPTASSSTLLQLCHVALLLGLWLAREPGGDAKAKAKTT
ncbi:alpha-1,3-mannosyltransferase ALG3 isoform c [Emiliania huxleyi CCMP1516]|uniref:dolichyl-P-Man:Man5GlcNAc2-PP-dolichol alpha-1,3-mannosyltransferase n=2 Tax=Emiliania huxleyi TaxID=2903 RepID=A0A0D3IGD2_EMIH1|nr:alpha-1,3-mannosyltransferase ALG3 isoform c [Emiliania huxleyi CCMP1516]EOD10317.1 alpha-1,3-mannosyltransferase ALG3 isoform c [Emiliania huxleyi CCMP1516]|eukprot:XP_005762746.1 alpha-1,3-mannosyltransferase ALG3 isoform c [Emiliania huxleyi CCMP1516]